MTRILLAVLALPVVAAVAVLVAIARLARELRDVHPDTVPQSAADDSEVVGMPTTWTIEPRTLSSARLSSLAELVMQELGRN